MKYRVGDCLTWSEKVYKKSKYGELTIIDFQAMQGFVERISDKTVWIRLGDMVIERRADKLNKCKADIIRDGEVLKTRPYNRVIGKPKVVGDYWYNRED